MSRGKELLLWLLGRRQRYRVSGDSMNPLLKAGDEVLVDPRAYRGGVPVVGDLVIACHPGRPELHIIKRVCGVAAQDCELAGDNPDPVKNSSYRIPFSLVLGRVTSLFSEQN